MERIRWGIIGCGAVTEVKSGPALQQAEGSELVAVMRRSGAEAADYARRHGVPRWYTDADQLIGDSDVDAVYIATPPDSHAEYVQRVANAGKPVYVEKPMARNHGECTAMLAACEGAGVPLFVAYYRRRLPGFLMVEELLKEGRVGAVRGVTLQLLQPPLEAGDALPWRVLPEISGGGLFFDLASHQFDLLDYLLGPVTSARGQAVNQAGLYPAEDAVSAAFTFASGALGSGLWCFAASNSQRTDRIEIIGSRGSITCSTFAPAPVQLWTESGLEEFPWSMPDHVQLPLIQTVVDQLLHRGVCPSTGASAARTSHVLDRIVADYYAGGRPAAC
jgi:predicted dehydrogenase